MPPIQNGGNVKISRKNLKKLIEGTIAQQISRDLYVAECSHIIINMIKANPARILKKAMTDVVNDSIRDEMDTHSRKELERMRREGLASMPVNQNLEFYNILLGGHYKKVSEARSDMIRDVIKNIDTNIIIDYLVSVHEEDKTPFEFYGKQKRRMALRMLRKIDGDYLVLINTLSAMGKLDIYKEMKKYSDEKIGNYFAKRKHDLNFILRPLVEIIFEDMDRKGMFNKAKKHVSPITDTETMIKTGKIVSILDPGKPKRGHLIDFNSELFETNEAVIDRTVDRLIEEGILEKALRDSFDVFFKKHFKN